jgi:hypothetical protein
MLALGGSSNIPDFFFLTREAFLRHAVPNYVTWNTPYYFTVDEGALHLPRLLRLDEPWYGYRVHEGQYASTASGLFDKTNGEIRTLVTAHAAGLYVHPPVAHASPRLARTMKGFLDIRSGALRGLPLRQLAQAIRRKRATLARRSSDATLLSYLVHVATSIDDLRAHNAGREPVRPLRLDSDAVRGVPTYSGYDAPWFFNELHQRTLPSNVAGLFAKEFDAIVAADDKALAWASTMMRFFAYATPVLPGRGAEASQVDARLVNSNRPHA